ncbi:YicC/YloC family endoribonuclease [Vitreoscilla stercoraria]|uniref:YicC family protein n=1 Tax=Vitreoscilla stercoraria TaxID=61 RepID=A0ABY4E6Q1_VITST|nr:YicC/YloC family endoribonuclease [Vitreoscilla stercoraria]UOO91447.1 YicC family protein [Vitreoscilla stercoraria]
MMMNSMTGFASAQQDFGSERINLELRAVNHRYLDLQFKMMDDLRVIEGKMRENIAASVARGKLECRIYIQAVAQQNGLHLNQDLVAELASINSDLSVQYPHLQALSVADILRFPGVVQQSQTDAEGLQAAVLALLQQVLTEFNQSRVREGQKLAQHLLERLAQMTQVVDDLQGIFPSLVQAHLEKTEQRLREAVENMEDDRIKQEFAIFMQKADVDEEMSRLKGHIAEVTRIVREGKGAVGKRLDFLMQELNREANTLGSKAIAIECTNASMQLKVLIEQMREQVQNIE